MSEAEIRIEVGPIETRVARHGAGRLLEIEIHPLGERFVVGALHLGRVRRVVPSLSAAFVELGGGPDGFLPLGHGRRPAEGAAVLVQVTRPPSAEKGARLTTAATLVGHRLVLAPFADAVRLSPRLRDAGERRRLEAWAGAAMAAHGFAFVVRSRAEGAKDAALAAEAEDLAGFWRDIVARAESGSAPMALDLDDDVVRRVLREMADGPVDIVIDDLDALARARAWCTRHRPDALDGLRHHAARQALFEAHDIEAAILAALAPEVALPSGGRLIIEPTRALVAIDVDSGTDGAEGGRGRTARRVDLEAAVEIACQLRLRAIGGLIVVDFLKLDSRADRDAVIAAFDAARAEDPTPTRHGGFSPLGLVEIARARNRPSLAEMLLQPGTPDLTARALAARMLREVSRPEPGATYASTTLRLVAVPEVIAAIPDSDSVAVALGQRLGRSIELVAEIGLARETWRLEAGGSP